MNLAPRSVPQCPSVIKHQVPRWWRRRGEAAGAADRSQVPCQVRTRLITALCDQVPRPRGRRRPPWQPPAGGFGHRT